MWPGPCDLTEYSKGDGMLLPGLKHKRHDLHLAGTVLLALGVHQLAYESLHSVGEIFSVTV